MWLVIRVPAADPKVKPLLSLRGIRSRRCSSPALFASYHHRSDQAIHCPCSQTDITLKKDHHTDTSMPIRLALVDLMDNDCNLMSGLLIDFASNSACVTMKSCNFDNAQFAHSMELLFLVLIFMYMTMNSSPFRMMSTTTIGIHLRANYQMRSLIGALRETLDVCSSSFVNCNTDMIERLWLCYQFSFISGWLAIYIECEDSPTIVEFSSGQWKKCLEYNSWRSGRSEYEKQTNDKLKRIRRNNSNYW